jgi:uncharacterized membrane protein
MNERLASPALPLALLAAASGARSMTGVAAVARVRSSAEQGHADEGIGPRVVSRVDRRIADVTGALAAFELMADKAPNIPDRVNAGPLFGRVAAGAVVGASIAQMRGEDRRAPAIAGAVIAFLAAHASFRLRRVLSDEILSFAAGLVEDAIVIGVASLGASMLARQVK